MKEKEYDLRGFKFEDVMDECSKYSSLEEQIDYLIYVDHCLIRMDRGVIILKKELELKLNCEKISIN
jgi:hypothetical protein